MTRPLVALYITVVGGFLNLQLLLAVIPLVVGREMGTATAGLATAALAAGTVLMEASMPYVLDRISHRGTLTIGFLLLGLPAFIYPLTHNGAVLISLTFARGIGFGIMAVILIGLVAVYAPAKGEGTSFGVMGVILGLLAIVGPPIGLVGNARFGIGPVAAAAGLVSLLAVVPVWLELKEPEGAPVAARGSTLRLLREGRMQYPVLIFAATTFAFGGLISLLPLATGAAPLVLFSFAIALTGARGIAGRLADRMAVQSLLVPGVLMATAGMGLVAAATYLGSTVVLYPGAISFGSGLGVVGTVSYLTLTRRASARNHVLASALWNLAYDSGTGLGGLALAAVGAVSYGLAFAVAAVLMGLTLPAAQLAASGRLEPRVVDPTAGPGA